MHYWGFSKSLRTPPSKKKNLGNTKGRRQNKCKKKALRKCESTEGDETCKTLQEMLRKQITHLKGQIGTE